MLCKRMISLLLCVSSLSAFSVMASCHGTYRKGNICAEYWTDEEGNKHVRFCATIEELEFETESWREILNMEDPSPEYRYYYVSELYDAGVLVDSWEFETLQELEDDLPDMLNAVGQTYTQAEFVDFMNTLTNIWVDPETDWHKYN